jgi:hypothetical protein
MKNFKKYIFTTFIYYLYNYILVISFASSVKFFRQVGDPEYQYSLDESIFSFHGNYLFMVVSYCIALLASSTLAYWIIGKPSKKAMFWISLPYSVSALAYGVFAIYVIFWTEFKIKDDFYDGYVFIALALLIPLLSIIWPTSKINITSSLFNFRKRHLLWIWIPLLFYLPAIFIFVIFAFFQGISDFFSILPSFKIIEGLKEVFILFLLSVLFRFYYKPLELALRVLNKEIWGSLGSLKRGGVIFAILTGGYLLAYGVHYLISLIPF